MVPSHALNWIDLGGHDINVLNRLRQTESLFLKTNLCIFHYHNHCYNQMIALTFQAVLSHGYVFRNDTKEMQIGKLKNLTDGYPEICRANSCHKAFGYLQHLLNLSLPSTVQYNVVPHPSNTTFTTTSIAHEIEDLKIKYAKDIEFDMT